MPAEPFQIYQVAGYCTGTLGLCRQPATDADFAKIKSWQPTIVLTLTGKEEFPTAGKSLPLQFQDAGYDWLHIPIMDFGVPPHEDAQFWQSILEQLHKILSADGKVLIHCKGGNGRSGMILLKLLVMQGEDCKTALARLRAVRAGAVETDHQYSWATLPL